MSETTMEVQEKEQSEKLSEGERERPTEEPSSGKSASSTSKEKSGRGRALLIFAVALLIAAAAGILYWLHARQFEDTDDAQIDGNLSPIGTRIDGNIVKVYVQNNQLVKVGDPLVDLDPRDNQVSLDQADAKVKQAESILSSGRPNVPITEI
jgi:membrane fusion protein, multidrug efflux system